tara:strand:+ start:16034 stop:16885 length:852 start_codon:yes stop_codon:yes gene_type:complete
MTSFALGTVQFGLDYGISNKSGQVKLDEVKSILRTCLENNVITLDTAYAYGQAEDCLGKFDLAPFDLITKIPKMMDQSSEEIPKFLQKSLKRLNIPKVKGVMFHNGDDLLSSKGEGYFKKLEEMKNTGKVDKIGVSVYCPEVLDRIIKNFDINIVQFPLNVFDQRMLESGLLKKLKNNNIETHARSAFLQGLFFLDEKILASQFSQCFEKVSELKKMAKGLNRSLNEVLLSFALTAGVDYVVQGVVSQKQLIQNLNTINNIIDFDFSEFSISDEQIINPTMWR